MTTTQRRPSWTAARATAWPWLPELTVINPGLSGDRSSSASAALKAPRTLNEPVRCSNSGLTRTASPAWPMSSAARSGVRRTWPEMRDAAARTAARWSSRKVRLSMGMIVANRRAGRGRRGPPGLRPSEQTADVSVRAVACRAEERQAIRLLDAAQCAEVITDQPDLPHAAAGVGDYEQGDV